LLTKPPSAAVPWVTISQSSGARISMPPQNAKVSITATRPSGIEACRRSISQPPITAVAWPPLKSVVVTTVFVPPMNCIRSIIESASLGSGTGRSAFQAMFAPTRNRTRAQTPPNDMRPSETSRNATPATIQMRADIFCETGDTHLTMPIATRISGQKRKMLPASMKPRLSRASTRPANITARPRITRGVSLTSPAVSSGLSVGFIVSLRP
jgi:hypothetical protein